MKDANSWPIARGKHQMKDANSWPIARGNAADTTNGCQMTNFSYVEKDLNSNEHLNINLE